MCKRCGDPQASRAYYLEHADVFRRRSRDFYYAHREEISAERKLKLATDPEYRDRKRAADRARLVPKARPTLADRFWDKVAMGFDSGCWLWTGTAGVYGLIWHDGRPIGAHVASWLIHNGPVPEGMEICHRCHTPLCVRPDHLRVDTHAENMAERFRREGRSSALAAQAASV